MTNDELVAIEARAEAVMFWTGDPQRKRDLIRRDVPALVAEVRRMQAEVCDLQEELGDLAFVNGQHHETIFRLERDIERLESEANHAYDVGLPELPPREAAKKDCRALSKIERGEMRVP